MDITNTILNLQKLTGARIVKADLARVLGIDPASLRRKELAEIDLKVNEIEKIEKFYKVKLNTTINKISMVDTVDIIYRPDVYLSAGYGADVYNEDKEFMTIDSRLLVSEHGNKINPANCEIVAISGNSMFPEYRHGDRVIIDKSDVELIDGHIFAFRYKNQCYVKEINLLGNKIKCISLNKEYDPFYISLDEEFTVFGRILPRIRL
jgi:phage repressor protein C with HTH and peptisase S24 domain